MKRILTILAAAICLWGCEDEPYYTEFWSVASFATIDAITGTYSLCSATWSSDIDLSGEGFATNDILCQLELFGWAGMQEVKYQDDTDFISVLYQSLVITPQTPEQKTQINLYVPFPEYDKGRTEELQKMERCNVDIYPYQFHYKVNSKGEIELFNVDERMLGGGTLENIKVRFEGRHIHFEATTSFYDWTTQNWQDGTMNLTYIHN